MKILMLSPNLASNSLGRTLPFYKKFVENNDVTLAGPMTSGIAQGYENLMEYYPIHISQTGKLLKESKELMNRDFDIVHIFKTRPGSMIMGMLARGLKGTPAVLDVDDLDYEKQWHPPNVFHVLFEHKTVNSTGLQKIYGGEIVYSGSDTDFVKPNVKGAEEFKMELGLEDKFVITFRGNPRRYKGLDTILESIKRLKIKDMKLLFMGSQNDGDFKQVYAKYGNLMKVTPLLPYDTLAKTMAITDLVVLPQKGDKPWTRVQTPVKLFDAMAAAKPIIVSNVGDMPQILGDSGIVLESDFSDEQKSKKGLRECMEQMRYVYDNPKEGKKLGQKARKSCEKDFSWDVLKRKTLEVYREAAE